MKQRKNKSNKTALAMCGLTLAGAIGGYALLSTGATAEKTQNINVGTIGIVFNHEGEAIALENAVPQTDQSGMANAAYDFTIENTGTIPVLTKLRVDFDKTAVDTSITFSKVRLVIADAGGTEVFNGTLADLKPDQRLDQIFELEAGATKSFTAKAWIAEDAVNEDLYGPAGDIVRTMSFKMAVDAVQSEGMILESNDEKWNNMFGQ